MIMVARIKVEKREGEEAMIDIHSHILPKVDDGSKDLEESIEMAKIYLENGINKVIATPHYIEGWDNTFKEKNLEILEILKKALYQRGLDLDIYLGNEIYTTMDILEHLEEGKASSLNNTRYVLIELPMFDIPLFIEDLIYELLLKGYVPIIAHPERNAKIIENPNLLYTFIKKGALAQLNLPSLEGKYGDRIKSTGETLIKHNMIHFIGTDAHSKDKRSPRVKKSLNLLKLMVDKETYNRITYLNGIKLLEDEEIIVDSPIEYKKEKNFFYLLKTKMNIF